MSGYNPNRHGKGSPEGGRFAPGDASRKSAGQIDFGDDAVDFDDIPTKSAFPEDMKVGDTIIDKDMQMAFRLVEPPRKTEDGRDEFVTDQGTFYGQSWGGMYTIEMTEEEAAEEAEAEFAHHREMAMERASIIKSQIELGVKMALGSSNFRATDTGLRFNARVLGMRKDGTRGSRVQRMTVDVDHNASDLYDITVRDNKGEVHAETSDVDVSNLNRALLAVDYDGDEPFNPRYWRNTSRTPTLNRLRMKRPVEVSEVEQRGFKSGNVVSQDHNSITYDDGRTVRRADEGIYGISYTEERPDGALHEHHDFATGYSRTFQSRNEDFAVIHRISEETSGENAGTKTVSTSIHSPNFATTKHSATETTNPDGSRVLEEQSVGVTAITTVDAKGNGTKEFSDGTKVPVRNSKPFEGWDPYKNERKQ